MKVWNGLMAVRVINLTVMKDSGPLKGMADIQIGPFTMAGCTIMERDQKRQFNRAGSKAVALVAFPPRTRGADGRWQPAVRIDEREIFDLFKSAILTAYNETVNNQEDIWACRKCEHQNPLGSYKCQSCGCWKNGSETEAYQDDGLNEAGKHFLNK